jgi:crossover junction endodeoxyribonuclease RuvC
VTLATAAIRRAAYPLDVKVLGIDPGTAACGYGIVHESDGRVRRVTSGCWRTSPRDRPEVRLKTIFDGVAALVAEHRPDAVALEESFVGADARTALFVGQARGAALVAAASAGVECTEYAPASVKQAVCGYGRAEKGQVQRMVRVILALDGEPATSHEADALAVAICHALVPPLARLVG